MSATTSVVEVTDASFAALVLGSARPVLLDYTAEWCAPCRQLEPVFAELATELAEQVCFARLDTTTNPLTPAEQRVLGLPTLHLFVAGERVGQLQGAKTKAQLREAVAAYL